VAWRGIGVASIACASFGVGCVVFVCLFVCLVQSVLFVFVLYSVVS